MRKAAGWAMLGALAGCAQAPAPAPPAPIRTPPPAPAPAPPPVAEAPDWRDLALSPGDWSYIPGGAQAAFGGAMFVLRCDPARRQIAISRIAAGAAAMTVTTSFGTRRLTLSEGGAVSLPAADPLFDQMAFSRGRFTVEVDGLERLVIPAWPEPARIAEDCRG